MVLTSCAETTDLWRKISFFVCIPGIAVAALWTYKAEMAHIEHTEHIK
jgi:cytochrome c oxidase subunit 6a